MANNQDKNDRFSRGECHTAMSRIVGLVEGSKEVSIATLQTMYGDIKELISHEYRRQEVIEKKAELLLTGLLIGGLFFLVKYLIPYVEGKSLLVTNISFICALVLSLVGVSVLIILLLNGVLKPQEYKRISREEYCGSVQRAYEEGALDKMRARFLLDRITILWDIYESLHNVNEKKAKVVQQVYTGTIVGFILFSVVIVLLIMK